jgi:hypothetical protein
MICGNATRDLRMLQKSQIEGREQQDDADVRHQPFPEAVLEEQQIHTNDNDYQRRHVKHDGRSSCHFDHPFI